MHNKKEIDRENRKMEYDSYLQSKYWKAKANYTRQRHGNRCAICGNRADAVHHLTYERVYMEDERDLIAICDECHKFAHGLSEQKDVLMFNMTEKEIDYYANLF